MSYYKQPKDSFKTCKLDTKIPTLKWAIVPEATKHSSSSSMILPLNSLYHGTIGMGFRPSNILRMLRTKSSGWWHGMLVPTSFMSTMGTTGAYLAAGITSKWDEYYESEHCKQDFFYCCSPVWLDGSTIFFNVFQYLVIIFTEDRPCSLWQLGGNIRRTRIILSTLPPIKNHSNSVLCHPWWYTAFLMVINSKLPYLGSRTEIPFRIKKVDVVTAPVILGEAHDCRLYLFYGTKGKILGDILS